MSPMPNTAALFWHLLTRLGEAQILLPLVLAAALWLWRGAAQGRLALRWLLGLGVAALLTTLSKLAFMGWGLGSVRWDFTGFSGHSTMAGACLPLLAWVALLGAPSSWRRAGVLAGFALAALVAYSRLVVHAHSPSEAFSGLLLGGAASLAVLCRLPLLQQPLPAWLPAGLAACLLLLPVSAPRSRSHELMSELSRRLAGREHVYTRHDLHRRFSAASSQPAPRALPPSRPSPR